MTDRQITHALGCWGWGPRHYECAVWQIERDEALLRQALEALIEQRREPDYQTGSAREAAIAALRERLGEGECTPEPFVAGDEAMRKMFGGGDVR